MSEPLPMDESQALAYVSAAAAALGLPLDEAQARRVARHLQRTAVLAEVLAQVPLDVHDEPAEIYRPSGLEPLPDGLGWP